MNRKRNPPSRQASQGAGDKDADRGNDPESPTTKPRSSRGRLLVLGVALVALLVVAVLWGIGRWDAKIESQFDGLLASQQYDAAAEVLQRRIWPLSPAEQAVKHARIARLKLQYTLADETLAAVGAEPGEYPSLDRESELLRLQETGEASSSKLQRLLEGAPDDTNALFQAWTIGQLNTQNFAAAGGVLSQWMQSEPSQATPRFYMGAMLNTQSDYVTAETYFREALRLDPDFDNARLGLIEVLARQNRQDVALPIAKRLIRRRPDDAEALMWRAQLLTDLNRPAEAEPDLRQALRLRPELYDARLMLGKTLLQQGRAQEAKETLLPILQTFEQDVATLYLLARCDAQLGATTDSDQWLDQYVQAKSLKRSLFHRTQKMNERLRQGVQATADQLNQMARDHMAADWKAALPWLRDMADKDQARRWRLVYFQASGNVNAEEEIRLQID
ncbi:tetratricopeptide repeat protein [Crateriforma conspicua]|uniref:Tetratricopeptide repeat protein n=1 Tax=Crateriforma conspicua TaxID=2527996 RepID=A0A5C5Y8F4_9PLAN|nr:tetratricopeptide repeat protein [Crateriforma conspicua]TWT70711.1 tetratricopeptide repeat protein [Crateriforma conspicua]